MSTFPSRELLLDVSRLIWRTWHRKLPTGIDRVCLEYVERFGPQSLAVVQFKTATFILSPSNSDRLFTLLRNPRRYSRIGLLRLAVGSLSSARESPPSSRMFYMNVGHTGLHHTTLPNWIAKHDLKAIYLIHDLIPITHPQFCRAGESDKHTIRMTHALLSASGIIGNSQATLEELAAFAAVSQLPMPSHIAAWISGSRLPTYRAAPKMDRPYFVTVGTIEARKNHLLLLQVWGELIASMGNAAPLLVIIGQRGWEAEEVFRHLDNLENLAHHVVEISSCGDEELSGWVASARALLMPSFVEGFGLPVIEALQLGTPVIASDLPVYREIVGNFPTYLDPRNRVAWMNTIKAFMTDGPERRQDLARLSDYAAPTWNDHFTKVERWLAQLRER